MAKSLEEHLYRSAKSKEEYMDVTTLKNRLQAIAHGLEVHRSSDSTTTGQHSMKNTTPVVAPGGNMGPNSNWSVASALRSNSGMSGLGGLLSQIDPGQMSSVSNAQPMGNIGHPGTAMHQRNMSATENYSGGTAGQSSAMSSVGDRWSSGPESNTSQSIVMDQRHGRPFPSSHDPSVGTPDPSSSTFQFNDSFPGHPGMSNVGSSYPNNSVSSDVNSHHANKPSWDIGNSGAAASSNENEPTATNAAGFSNSSQFQDPTAAQKMRVILQQQQRLLLLRHASKCTAGPQCTTKFCEQMVTLWKHMRTCRDKSCKTSHCLSSRCVLNHYRICKSNGRTLTCEVCGPVMLKIKQQERDDGTSDDPLTRDQEMSPTEQPPIFTPVMNPTAIFPQASSSSTTANQSQLSQVQASHSRLKAQLDILKLLQKQQEQLLEQQRSLEAQAQNISDPNSPQFLQLQEQQLLLQQLQKRCQQQQLLVQHELQMQTSNVSDDPNQTNATNEPLEPVVGNMHSPETLAANVQNTSEPSGTIQNRMGFGGKRQGKSLVLPPSRKSKATGSDGSKNAAAKKAKVASKQKSLRSVKPELDPVTSLKSIDEDHVSVLSCMSPTEINKHLESLNKQIILSSRTVTHKCRPILQELLDDPFGWVFHDAVDPVALGLPDYFDVIKNPMHMDLVRKKLENAIYSDMESFARDMRLVFQNAILYNGESSEVGELAQSMMSRFDTLYNAVVAGTGKVVVFDLFPSKLKLSLISF
jgi:Bromodomain/TAZ zinc finger